LLVGGLPLLAPLSKTPSILCSSLSAMPLHDSETAAGKTRQ
jgi:hypothetical protein